MVSRYLDATKVGTGAWRQPRSLAFAIGASDMDDQESKPNVKKLTLVCQTTTAASLEHREMEELAAAVATQFLAVTRNLRMIRPQIERIRRLRLHGKRRLHRRNPSLEKFILAK